MALKKGGTRVLTYNLMNNIIPKSKHSTRALTSDININLCPKSKRSQVTIFVIIAIIIVAAALLVFFIYPKISSTAAATSPESYIQSCMEKELENALNKVSLQGGKFNPEFYTENGGIKVSYLCYTSEYYDRCVMQQPLLKSSIENEIKEAIKQKKTECFNSLKANYQGKGYTVDLNEKDYSVDILPKKITVNFDYSLTLTKGATDKYNNLEVNFNTKMYSLILVATKILDWESQYGDADISGYMNYYSWLKIERTRETDGTKIYILSDRDTKEKLQFAVRSVAWPPGYGLT